MPTNAIGTDTKNLTVNIPEKLHANIATLAKKSGCKSVGEYVRGLLINAQENDLRITQVSEKRTYWVVEGADAETLPLAAEPPATRKYQAVKINKPKQA